MDPPPGNDLPPTPVAGDEGTIIANKKRSRRVSFAETTAIHVFDRDEDFETPPGSADSSSSHHGSSADSSAPDDNASAAFSDSSDDDDSAPVLLFRDIDSSSPGSALGSVTSNDDDNFFGPVSASFIRSGMLSETEVSEDNNNNHDITLDSTAFSLHYRNIGPADDRSVGSIKTPTEMVPTRNGFFEKRDNGDSASVSHDAMSLIADDSKRYDYGKISPSLEALMAEVDRSLRSSSPSIVRVSGKGNVDLVPVGKLENGDDDGLMDTSANQIGSLKPSNETIQGSPLIDASANEKAQDVVEYCRGDREAAQHDVVTDNSQNIDLLSPPYREPRDSIHFQSANINQTCFSGKENTSKCYPPFSPWFSSPAPELTSRGNQQELELESGVCTPTNAIKAFQIPMHGSVSSIHAKRQKLYVEEPSSRLKMEFKRHDEKIFAIKNQITRFKNPETPILVNFQAAMSIEDNTLLDPEGTAAKVFDIPNSEHVSVLVDGYQKNLINAADTVSNSKKSDLEQSGFDTPKNAKQNDKNIIIHGVVKSTATTPNSQLMESGIHVNQEPLMSQKRIDEKSSPISSSPQQKKFDLKSGQAGDLAKAFGGAFGSSDLLEENKVQSLTSVTYPVSDDLRSLKSQKETASNSDDCLLGNTREKAVSSKDIHVRSQDMNTEIKNDLIDARERLSQTEACASSCEPACGDASKESAIAKDIPSTIEPNMSPAVGEVRRKRKNGQFHVKENDTIKKISRAPNSLNLLPKAVHDITAPRAECDKGEMDVGGQATMTRTSIIIEVSDATKELFSTSVYKFTSEKIDMLETLLSELQTARKYERFCATLSNHERTSDVHQKRKSEARLLQDKLLFEQVKLQLKRVKLQLLHNKTQLCESRAQECHSLKSMLSQFLCGTRASQTHETNPSSDSIHSSNANQEVASKKQELEILDQKMKCLVKSLEASCKIKGNMDIGQTIKVLNENLETRKRHRIIRHDLQLWELSDVVKKNDCSEIVLNYCNLLSQRFRINIGQASSIIANNLLNEANIEKNFPKMNAQLAFEFIFNAKGAHRLADSKCFQHETLVTSLLLGTLLDVIKEVHISRGELWNLVQSSFYSQCPGQIELRLSFLNFKSYRKVTLGLDMTFLGSGVYPCKSSELQLRIVPGLDTTMSPSVLDEITCTAQSIQDGRPMILKLCRRTSELVQASNTK